MLFGEPGGDGGIVGGGAGIGFAGEAAAEFDCGAAGGELAGEFGVLGGVGEDGDEIVVLGGGADQGGAADVDVFDAVVVGRSSGNRGFEGVEVHRDEVDRGDVVFAHLGQVLGQVAAAEDAAVDLRDQGFDTAVEDFGEAGVVGDLFHRDTGLAQGFGGAAGGEDFDAVGSEGAGEVDEAGFVGDGDQGAADGDDAGHGRRLAGAGEFAPRYAGGGLGATLGRWLLVR